MGLELDPSVETSVVQRRAVEDSLEAVENVVENVTHADAATHIGGEVAMLESDMAWVEHAASHLNNASGEDAGEVAAHENEPAREYS